MNYRGLIPFSGGIDSTAALYHTLTQYPDEQFLVFKVNLVNGHSGSRAVMEERAVNAILEELRKMGIHNFTYRRLSFDYAQLGTPPIWDSEAVNFAAATCIRAHPEIYEFVEGAIADDFLQAGFDERISKIEKILYLVSEKTKECLNIVFPLKDLYKYEVMKLMPQNILSLTWSCRFPIEGENWDLQRCKTCHTCKVVNEVIATHGAEFPDFK